MGAKLIPLQSINFSVSLLFFFSCSWYWQRNSNCLSPSIVIILLTKADCNIAMKATLTLGSNEAKGVTMLLPSWCVVFCRFDKEDETPVRVALRTFGAIPTVLDFFIDLDADEKLQVVTRYPKRAIWSIGRTIFVVATVQSEGPLSGTKARSYRLARFSWACNTPFIFRLIKEAYWVCKIRRRRMKERSW